MPYLYGIKDYICTSERALCVYVKLIKSKLYFWQLIRNFFLQTYFEGVCPFCTVKIDPL